MQRAGPSSSSSSLATPSTSPSSSSPSYPLSSSFASSFASSSASSSYAPQTPYSAIPAHNPNPRPSFFSPIIIVPMCITPTVTADQAAAFNEFVPVTAPPPKYNDRFRRPSKRNLRQALERLETTYGPWHSHLPTPRPSSPEDTLSPASAASGPSSSSAPPFPPLQRSPPSYEIASRLPPSYPSHASAHPSSASLSQAPEASTSSLIPGWDKHPVRPTEDEPVVAKRPRRSLLDILMPGLNRGSGSGSVSRIFGRRRNGPPEQRAS